MVFIITEGGANIGFGHITRCISLYEGFIEKGIITKLIINRDKSIDYLLRGKHYQILNWLKEEDKLLELIDGADIVVIDSYLADKSIYDRISEMQRNRLLVMLDDYKRIDYPRGIVVNPSISADTLNYSPKKDSIYLLGNDYIILRKQFWNVPKKKIRKETKDILITFGGKNHKVFTIKIIQFLISNFPGFNYHVIIPAVEHSSCSLNFGPKIRLYANLTALAMRNLMLKCDIAISGGGQTTYELARCGLPAIGICCSDNQRFNLEGLHREGFLEYIGRYNDIGLLNKIYKTIALFRPQKIRKEKSAIGTSLVDGKGVRRILTSLLMIKPAKNKYEEISLRKATKRDSYYLWTWRNHHEVRKQCFDTGDIDYDKHKSWFEKKIKSKKSKIYIAINRRKEKVGQVRFDANGRKSAYINVNLNPEFFAKGLGNKIIRKATEVFRQENPEVKEVIAEVINDNIASKKAFQKGGYKYLHSIVRNSRQIAIFKFP